MRLYWFAGTVGLILVLAGIIAIVCDRIYLAGIPEMAFVDFWRAPFLSGNLARIGVLCGLIGMLAIGFGIGGYSATRSTARASSEDASRQRA